MDATSLETIELFESRVHRLEYTLYGEATPEHQTAEDATIAEKLEDLERRFASLVTHVRVYNELFKVCRDSPLLTHRLGKGGTRRASPGPWAVHHMPKYAIMVLTNE